RCSAPYPASADWPDRATCPCFGIALFCTCRRGADAECSGFVPDPLRAKPSAHARLPQGSRPLASSACRSSLGHVLRGPCVLLWSSRRSSPLAAPVTAAHHRPVTRPAPLASTA